MKKKMCIIGDGGWGTALALTLSGNGYDVTVWGPFPDYIERVRKEHENPLYLPGITLPGDIKWTSDREQAAAGAHMAVIAVPTKFFRNVMESFNGLVAPSSLVVSVAKGLDPVTHQRMTQVADDVLGIRSAAALSGPSHAEEVARRIVTAVTVAGPDAGRSVEIQKIFSNKFLRVYTSDDVIGVELGGALKNVIAIGAGVSDGLGFGDNTKAVIMTRGLAEITRLGVAMGAKPATFAGLSGMGDMIVTCTSRHSRNRAVGERLGRGESIEQILASMKQVAEGVSNCVTVREIAGKTGVEVPITEEVYQIIHNHKNPRDAVQSLLARDLRKE